MNYTEIQSTVASLSHRSDLGPKMQGFIALAEKVIFRELSLRNIETSETGTTSGDTIAMPAGVDSIQRIEIEQAGRKDTLNYTSPNGIASLTGFFDKPTRFLIENSAIRLIPAPNGAYTYTIFFVPLLTALSNSNPENWLSENHPDVYINAAMIEVGKYKQDDAVIARYTPFLASSLDSVARADERKRFPVSGGMQIKPRRAR